MSVGYLPGAGPLHRAHPFTPLTLAAVLSIMAFVLPAPWGPAGLCLLAGFVAIAAGVPAVLRPAALSALPFWVFLFVIHGLMRHMPLTALGLAARITAVLVAFLTALAVVQPARLVDALLERGFPFSLAYVFAATLTAVPRFRSRARQILDAQRSRGLRVRGSVGLRVRAVVPLAIPLILGALTEVDERAFALEARGMSHVGHRTPLHPPADSPLQRMGRWAMVGLVVVAIGLRVLR